MKLNNDLKLVLEFSDVINILSELSQSQGFYGRLLRDIAETKKEAPEYFDMFVEEIESQNFRTMLDVIMYFER